MADSGKRVIVDGVEFGRVWLFPRILGAITAAMQPGRLLVALFMVILLIALGRLWDRYTEPNVAPGGLIQGRYVSWIGDGEHQSDLAAAVMTFAPQRGGTDPMAEPNFKTREVLEWMREGYLEERGKATSEDQRQQIDAAYTTIMRQIESSRPRGDFEATVDHLTASFRLMLGAALDLNPRGVLAGADQFFIQTPRALWQHQTWFAIVYGLVFLVVFALGGGAISRMAAMQHAREQRLSINEATDFALHRLGGLVWAQVLPLIIFGVIAAVVMGIGFLMRVPVLDVITALLYFFVLLLGFLMAFLLVGYAIGFPLLVPAVACENCDGADAMQRSFAYIINRPLHALWYWAVALFGLAIGFTIFGAVALLTLNLAGAMFSELASGPAVGAAGGYQPGTFDHPMGAEVISVGAWHERWAASIILAWQSLVVCLVVAYVLSYHFSASTIAYLLMRKASDGQEPDEVWRPGLIPGTLAPVPPAIGAVTKEVNQEP